MYLQPAQRLSHAEDGNEASDAESRHAHLWGLREKETERQTDHEFSELGKPREHWENS